MNNSRRKKGSYTKKNTKSVILQSVIFSLILIICSLFQISFFKVFGVTPAIVLCFVCAIGFLCGERVGAICGIVGGFFIDMLGSVGISLSVVLFMLVGYFCGCMPKTFLTRNFPSYLVYSFIIGILKSAVTIAQFALFSNKFNIIEIFSRTLLPEFFAYMLYVPIAYFICLLVRRIIIPKRKDQKY